MDVALENLKYEYRRCKAIDRRISQVKGQSIYHSNKMLCLYACVFFGAVNFNCSVFYFKEEKKHDSRN